MSKVIKFVACGDNHGDLQDDEACDALFAYCKEFKPDERIHLGDCFDFRSLRKGVSSSDNESAESLNNDLEYGCEFLKRFAPTVYLWGNHEDRLDYLINTSSSALVRDFCIDRKDLINRIARQSGAKKIYPYHSKLGFHTIGSVGFVHGYNHGLNATIIQGSHYTRNGVKALIHGHTHNLCSIALTQHDSGMAFSAGCLCDKDAMSYAKNRLASSRWGSGFVAGIIDGTEYKAWLVHKVGSNWVFTANLTFYKPKKK